MTSTKRIRRAVVLGGIGVLIGLQMAAAATAGAQTSAGGPIRPNQVFGALVNGQNGASAPAVIEMGCYGPLKPGQTGHPLRGQTVTVYQPEDIVGDFGNTGPDAHEIGAFFGPPPPASLAGTSGPVFFHRYRTLPIPTSEILPCSGSGQVTFVPLPLVPGVETVAVPVVFAPQP
jgi:hypothetical protein